MTTLETTVLILIGLFSLKHLIVDFPLQVPYMYLNKGTFLHPGGLVHAGLHALVSGLILVWYYSAHASWAFKLFSLHQIVALGLMLVAAEFVLHYLIDYAKMNLNRIFGWYPMHHWYKDSDGQFHYRKGSEQFWWMVGLDQFLHMLTYIGMVWATVDVRFRFDLKRWLGIE